MSRPRIAAAAAVTLAVTLTGGCTAPHRRDATKPSVSAVAVTRWWSNAENAAGSTIDPTHPSSAAKQLAPSRSQYCRMLKDTVAAGQSILPGIDAHDPARTTATEAFLAELTRVAPPAVAAQWDVVGRAMLALLGATASKSSIGAVDATGVSHATSAIAADAHSACGLNISVSRK